MSGRELKLEYALALMVYQYCQDRGTLYHQHMTAGEEAFRILEVDIGEGADKLWERIDKLREQIEQTDQELA